MVALSSKYISTVLCAIVFFILGTHVVSAADVLIAPATGSYASGQTFTVAVQANPRGDSINAVEAELSFDSDVLSVVSISKDGSAFSLWTTEPTFSNSAGTIAFGGGSPSPFTTQSNLVSITFRAAAAGTGAVSFSDASVLAADGLGTDVAENTPGATYTIATADVPPPTPPTTPEEPADVPDTSDEAITFGDPPRAPEVGSQAFLDTEVWYSDVEGVFTWDLPFDVTAVRVELATSSDHEPTEEFDPPIESFLLNEENAREGVQYLSVQYRNQVGWGAVTNRKIMIDTESPLPFTIDVRPGTRADSFPQLRFEANDETSGIDFYELIIADQEPFVVSPDEAALGYMLRDLEDGTYTVTITAHDRAGNETTSSAAVLITAGWEPPSEEEDTTSFWDFFTATTITIILLIMVIIGEFGYILMMRKKFSEKENALRKETKEIQEQMEKIFSALRDEIYDQILSITKRPRLSKKEKEAVEGLNQALEVSETLIEKEVADVNSVLK